MTTFDEWEKAFEAKLALEEELGLVFRNPIVRSARKWSNCSPEPPKSYVGGSAKRIERSGKARPFWMGRGDELFQGVACNWRCPEVCEALLMRSLGIKCLQRSPIRQSD